MEYPHAGWVGDEAFMCFGTGCGISFVANGTFISPSFSICLLGKTEEKRLHLIIYNCDALVTDKTSWLIFKERFHW
jgi:hypothetical protein